LIDTGFGSTTSVVVAVVPVVVLVSPVVVDVVSLFPDLPCESCELEAVVVVGLLLDP
jgi:hypothetical protein